MRSRSQKSSLRNIKLTLEYDGSRFFGFQRQKDEPTIQAALEEALSKLFNRRMKISAAAGRTDAGVHAEGQVVNFKTDSKLPLERIQKSLNALLPKDIAVKEIEEVHADFHARYGARWKTYEYTVLNSSIRSPLQNGHVYQFHYPLDLAKMKKAARRLLGRHDFKAFQATGSSARSSIRFIRRIHIERRGNLIRFTLEADGFLYHMVRRLVGTILEVGRGALSLADFLKLFGGRKRFLAGPTVPSHGLSLALVRY
jgi:tRNA pseudouridine38-40 synthase